MGEDAIPGGDQDSAQHARRRLTVAQAAEVMDVTVDAIRARIKRETIEHVREGGRVYVILVTDQDDTSHDQDHDQYTAQSGAQPETGPAYRDELVEELRDRVQALEEANRENRRIIAGLIQRVPELAPGNLQGEPRGPETVSETSEGVDAPTDRGERETASSTAPPGRVSRASWWRRFFGFE